MLYYRKFWVVCLTFGQLLWSAYLINVPDTKCLFLEPDHVTGTAQTNSPPYYIQLQQVTYSSSEIISVILSSEKPFHGFLLQARSVFAGGNSSVGVFLDPLPNGTKYLSCPSPNGTVSDEEGFYQSFDYLRFQWQAPSQDLGNISFRASVIYNTTTYWTGVEADRVLVYQSYVKSSTVKPVPTSPWSCPIVTCRCPGAEITKNEHGCIKSCKCKYPCSSANFRCKNGHCISLRYKCDGDFDCEDNSDEEDCPSVKSRNRTSYWYTPGRNAAVGVAIVLMLVIITYYMYRRYTMMYNQQGLMAVMSGQSWFRRPSQRERDQTQLEIINAIIEARFDRQNEPGPSVIAPSDLPPYSLTDNQDVKPPPSYDQVCGQPPPDYSEETRTVTSQEPLEDTNSLNFNSVSSVNDSIPPSIESRHVS